MRTPDNDHAPWQATAGYLYLLRLDAASLAWEYLRRDPGYRACWRRYGYPYGRRAPSGAARPWGLVQLEDPQLDARRAHPVWDDRMPALLHVYAGNCPIGEAANSPSDASLDLWHIPGEKHLVALPAGGYALQARDDAHCLRARLGAGVLDGQPALCAVPLDARLHTQAALLAAHAAHFAPRRAAASGHAPHPARRHVHLVTQASLHHLHALQALDGAQAGASQRRIAEALYGAERVREQWHADSALRAQVRHSLARGYALMRGGYRQLAGLAPTRTDRSANTPAAAA